MKRKRVRMETASRKRDYGEGNMRVKGLRKGREGVEREKEDKVLL